MVLLVFGYCAHWDAIDLDDGPEDLLLLRVHDVEVVVDVPIAQYGVSEEEI